MKISNFLPEQYESTGLAKINHNYLTEQFADCDEIWLKIREVVRRGDFTLGKDVDRLEEQFSKVVGGKNAIAVGSGTDALFLSLKAADISDGDEVITTPFTFYATIGAIVTSGAKPIFCDIQNDYNINASELESKITSKTKAIMPVHWSGNPCDMDLIEDIGRRYGLPIISDACHAVGAEYNEKLIGSFGDVSCFSFHPLKNLNVWGDGGIVVTDSDEIANRLRLLRNHGLESRDSCKIFSYNSRLDTIQAVVALHLLDKLTYITDRRIANAEYFDLKLSDVPQIRIPERSKFKKHVYHIYSILCERRDDLFAHLVANGVDAKIHYPTPMHLQPAAKSLNHVKGDFPVTEMVANCTLSLPVHEFITQAQQDEVLNLILEFYQ